MNHFSIKRFATHMTHPFKVLCLVSNLQQVNAFSSTLMTNAALL